MKSYIHGLDVLGESRVIQLVDPIFDIGARQREMNTIKPVTLAIADKLIKAGQSAIKTALMIGQEKNLPFQNDRKNVAAKLDWHANELKMLPGGPDSEYPVGDDLKKWVMQAFIEANAVHVGVGILNDNWNQMWVDMGDNAKGLSDSILKIPGVTDAVSTLKWVGIAVVAVLGIGVVVRFYPRGR